MKLGGIWPLDNVKIRICTMCGKTGVPHSRLYAFNSIQIALFPRHARFTALGLDCCNFPCPPTHEYSYSPLVAGFLTNFRPTRAKRWCPPPLRMRGELHHFHLTVKIHQFQLDFWPVHTCYESWAARRNPPLELKFIQLESCRMTLV